MKTYFCLFLNKNIYLPYLPDPSVSLSCIRSVAMTQHLPYQYYCFSLLPAVFLYYSYLRNKEPNLRVMKLVYATVGASSLLADPPCSLKIMQSCIVKQLSVHCTVPIILRLYAVCMYTCTRFATCIYAALLL
jgi:hypothetical protein